MASERSSLEFHIKTSADLTAARDTRKALEDAIKQTESLGKDSSALKAQLAKVDAALLGESAAAVRAAEALEKVIAAKKKLGADTSGEQKALAGIKNLLGANPRAVRSLINLRSNCKASPRKFPACKMR